MPNINQQINNLAINIHKMHNSRSVLGIDERGELIRVKFKGQVARALLHLGVGQEGKWGHRLVTYLAGKEHFDLFCQSHQVRYANSMRNISQITKRLETRKLDSNLTKLVNMKIDTVLHKGKTHLTVSEFIDLHTRIRTEVVDQQLAHRASLREKMSDQEATPAIANATYRGVAIAAAALQQNMEKHVQVHQLLDVSPNIPATRNFAEEVCGKRHDSQKLEKDVWDANKVLREFKSAELDVRKEAQSDIKELKSEYKNLHNKLALEGATTPPDKVADWELQLHQLKTKIKHNEEHFEEHVDNQMTDLKNNLLATLKESFDEKQALSKLTAAEASKPVSQKQTGALKPALKVPKELRFGGIEVQKLEESFLLPGFVVDDSNRAEWVQHIKTLLNDDSDSQTPYAIAKTLEQRGRRNADDPQTVKEINLLRTHPTFLQAKNFESLLINIRSAAEEVRRAPEKFSDEVKQNYRDHVETFKELANQQLETTKELLAKLDVYKGGIDKLDEDPAKREIKEQELNEQLGEYREYFESYKNTFEDSDPNLTVRNNIRGKVIRAHEELRQVTRDLKDSIDIMLMRLTVSSLFVDKKKP